MKKLSLAFTLFALTACGNTPKNEVGRTVPQPSQSGETTEDFLARCRRNENGLGSGDLSPDNRQCRRVVYKYSHGRVNNEDYVVSSDLEEVMGVVGAGAAVSGTFEGTTLPPEITIESVPFARGNVDPARFTDRQGTVRLKVASGAYRSINYRLAVCFGQGNDYEPCKNF